MFIVVSSRVLLEVIVENADEQKKTFNLSIFILRSVGLISFISNENF